MAGATAKFIDPSQVEEPPEKLTNEDVAFCRAFIASQNKGIVTSFPGLKIFNESDHAAELRHLACGMSIEEICDYYGIIFEELPETDKFFFCRMFLKGRTSGALRATEALFSAMKDRDGARASLTYLKNFAPGWRSIDKEDVADNKPRKVQIEVIGNI